MSYRYIRFFWCFFSPSSPTFCKIIWYLSRQKATLGPETRCPSRRAFREGTTRFHIIVNLLRNQAVKHGPVSITLELVYARYRVIYHLTIKGMRR